MTFAKLYETSLGQILVKKDENDEGMPEVRFYFQPNGLGICNFSISFKDDDQGYDSCDLFFDKVNEETAILAITEATREIGLDSLGEVE